MKTKRYLVRRTIRGASCKVAAPSRKDAVKKAIDLDKWRMDTKSFEKIYRATDLNV